MSDGLKDKVALVTGASRGIGAAIAKRLAEDGAAVAITYAAQADKADEVVRAIKAAGGKALAIRADAADAAAVRSAVTKTVEAFGRLDVLVNNAGLGLGGPLDQFSLEDFDRLMAVNVRGLFVAAQEAIKHMHEGGRIINIGSIAADTAPMVGFAAYSASKGAVASMTRGWARDLGSRGITVNNVQPGPIDTDMNPADGQFGDVMRGWTSLNRYGTSKEVAALVSYLASPEAAFVTGASIDIDGGVV
ncbi:MAG: 3-oxoacyl-ACP reductase family protein [Methylocella sp.]